jgi:hypothetical protein
MIGIKPFDVNQWLRDLHFTEAIDFQNHLKLINSAQTLQIFHKLV